MKVLVALLTLLAVVAVAWALLQPRPAPEKIWTVLPPPPTAITEWDHTVTVLE